MTLIDLDGPYASDMGPDQRRFGLLVAGAAVLGALLGGLAVHQVSSQARRKADSNAVSVLILAQAPPASLPGGDWGGVSVNGPRVEIDLSTRAIVVNSGPEPIDLLGIAGHGPQDGNGYQVELTQAAGQPRIPPGTSATVDLAVKVRCGGRAEIRTDMQAALTVRTTSGEKHVATVGLDAGPWSSDLQITLESCMSRADLPR